MCGFFAKQRRFAEEEALLAALDITQPYPNGQWYQRGIVPGLITATDSGYGLSEALWWYALRKENNRWVVNEDITSFNARNLDNRLSRNAIKARRAIVLASEIGEAQGKDHYLMKSQKPLVLGVIYKDWSAAEGPSARSMALITRPPHPRFSRYHSKSIPCFMPLDVDFIKTWLNPEIQHSVAIDAFLDRPKIYTDLEVLRVKTYKRAEPLGEPELLPADESEH